MRRGMGRGGADRAERAEERDGRRTLELPHRGRPRHRAETGQGGARGRCELARERASSARLELARRRALR
eukprot:845865-Pyramimonas_sp.AAC.1